VVQGCDSVGSSYVLVQEYCTGKNGKGGEVGMKDHKVPVQSLIDHIKTAIDVDDWAKEMVEELLKEQQKLIDEITQRRANNGAFD